MSTSSTKYTITYNRTSLFVKHDQCSDSGIFALQPKHRKRHAVSFLICHFIASITIHSESLNGGTVVIDVTRYQ